MSLDSNVYSAEFVPAPKAPRVQGRRTDLPQAAVKRVLKADGEGRVSASAVEGAEKLAEAYIQSVARAADRYRSVAGKASIMLVHVQEALRRGPAGQLPFYPDEASLYLSTAGVSTTHVKGTKVNSKTGEKYTVSNSEGRSLPLSAVKRIFAATLGKVTKVKANATHVVDGEEVATKNPDAHHYTHSGPRLSEEAMVLVQRVTCDYLKCLGKNAAAVASNGGRVTRKPKDLLLATKMC